MAYDRERDERDRYDRERLERERGAFDRAGDEVRSWFGDDEARRRRERDERENERAYRPDRPYAERSYGVDRSYSDRYGRSYSAPFERERDHELDRGPAFQPYARGATSSFGAGSQEFGPEGYGSRRAGSMQGYGREWRGSESWRVPGPHTGRGPKGYQRTDERIREEINDRLTAHGLVDATDVEVRIQGGEVTLTGFVDSRDAKRAAEDCAEDVSGVREVHNHLRIRSHADDTGVGRTSVLGLTEHETQTPDTARAVEARERQAEASNKSRARNT